MISINLWRFEPQDAASLKIRGYVHYWLDQYEDALLDFNKSLELEPNNVWALKQRGEVYRMLKKYDNAETLSTSTVQRASMKMH